MEAKYILRRIFLTALLLVTVAGLFWLVWSMPEPEEEVSEPGEPSEAESVIEPSEPEESEPEEEPQEADPDDSWHLMLVSPANPLGREYAPPELDYITGEYAVDSRIGPALRTMIADAKLEGVTLMVCSAYRDADYQETLHNRQIEYYRSIGQPEEEAIATASAIVVPPGTSEHQTGLAVDIVEPDYQTLDDGFADTVAAKWLYDNAWKYGFILRYPRDKTEITKVIFEPWHYRYVGEEHAAYIREREICLEEYLWQHSATTAATRSEPGDPETGDSQPES